MGTDAGCRLSQTSAPARRGATRRKWATTASSPSAGGSGDPLARNDIRREADQAGEPPRVARIPGSPSDHRSSAVRTSCPEAQMRGNRGPRCVDRERFKVNRPRGSDSSPNLEHNTKCLGLLARLRIAAGHRPADVLGDGDLRARQAGRRSRGGPRDSTRRSGQNMP